MNDEVQQIKDRLDIVEVISSYLTIKKAGVNFKANCPFHNEKTPSFMVSPERQTFKCFGCGEGGDVFTFVEKMEGLDFYNTLKLLAERAGIQLKQKSFKHGNKEYKADKKTRIIEINDWAKKVYHKILSSHPKAEEARKYLKKRGLNDETVSDFEIGYAPDSWDFLLRFLKSKGYTPDEMVQAGVLIRNSKNDFYDRFRGRVMFPINNVMGTTVAFTSRILKDDKTSAGGSGQAKYINSSESPIYTKGKTIYGLDKAKLVIKEESLAIFVEGNMDVISCHQAGFKNVVATSGTAITEEQLKILSRYADDIAFSFDKDEAGEAAMKKAVKLALKNDITSKIIFLNGPYKDPDEAIKADPKNWVRAVENAKPSLEYWIDLLARKNPSLDVSTKKRIAKEILPVIKTIYSPIEKEYYIKYLSKKLSITEKALLDALEKTKSDSSIVEREKETKKFKLTLCEKILGLLWYSPKIISKNLEKFDYLNMSEIGGKIILSIKENKGLDKKTLSEEEINYLNQLSMSAMQDLDEESEEQAEKEVQFLFIQIEKQAKEKIKNDFAKKIQEAESMGDTKALKKLLNDFSNLIK